MHSLANLTSMLLENFTTIIADDIGFPFAGVGAVPAKKFPHTLSGHAELGGDHGC